MCTVCYICSVFLCMFNDARWNVPFFRPILRISSKVSNVTFHAKSSGSRLCTRTDSRSFASCIHSPGQCLVVHGTFCVLLSGSVLPLCLSVPPIPHRGSTGACQPLPNFSPAAGLHLAHQFGQDPSRVLRKCDRRHSLWAVIWHVVRRRWATPLAVRWFQTTEIRCQCHNCNKQLLHFSNLLNHGCCPSALFDSHLAVCRLYTIIQ
jgi:hypothetical protein